MKTVLMFGAFVAIIFAMAGYSIYEQLPNGYSSASKRKLMITMAAMKIFDLAVPVATALGFGSHFDIMFKMVKSMHQTEIDPTIHTEDALFGNVSVRIFTPPATADKVRPGIIFYHGGGWVFGDVDAYSSLILILTKETNAIGVFVNYRLAPEWVFPAAHDDSYTATEFFLRHASDYNVDPQRIALVGDSAGGNLAASIALKLRDEAVKPLARMQVLIYPTVQFLDIHLPSMIQNSASFGLSSDIISTVKSMFLHGNDSRSQAYATSKFVPQAVREQLATSYLNVNRLPDKYLLGYEPPHFGPGDDDALWNEIKDKVLNPYLSPLFADDLSNLPMSYMLTCEFDVLRDEGFLYAYRLKDAGNNVMHVNWDIGFHGLLSHVNDFPEARMMLNGVIKYIVKNL